MGNVECRCRGWSGIGSVFVAWAHTAAANPRAHHPNCPAPTTVSEHAVDRFIERHQPVAYWRTDKIDHAHPRYRMRARQQLVLLMQESVLDSIEDGRNSIWRTPTGILLGVRDHIVATVLPRGSRRPDRRPKRRRA